VTLQAAITDHTTAHRAARHLVVESNSFTPEQGATMFGHLGIPELIVILFIIILIFGANRLPEIGRGIGKGIRNFKDATRNGGNGT
jgi:sec-independent protein translocase protein TatA